ncbi:MAG: FAD-dependent oxidoreductase [Bacteroidota bacterium]
MKIPKQFPSFLILLLLLSACSEKKEEPFGVDVLVIGGGASGVMAGIQSARMDVPTLIVEETPWLGGMLTSAGVSAIDGNYELSSGLWEEFRQELIAHYGHADSLKTGWVSNVLFEPQVGAQILERMAKKEQKLAVWYGSKLISIEKKEGQWHVTLEQNGTPKRISANTVIDATELGNVAKTVGIPYDVGMDSRKDTGEEIAPKEANNIVQDLTYVAILKDYGPNTDKTIEKPKNYDPTPFLCTCKGSCDEEQSLGRAQWDCDKMMEYGKLPNGYYMINWPIFGNDYYLNLVEMDRAERNEALKKAKEFTLHYVYYLQTELGFKNLGIADDVYPTEDKFPFIPYHRESRRIQGIVQFDINDLARPFEQEDALYRTGIAVGDYPIDHHHHAYPEFKTLPDLHFYPVPSYTIPLGSLIPEHQEDFIVAEKSISVTNLVNGTTRLQPVCILIGQAAGTLAALSVKLGVTPKKVPVRAVQKALLDTDAYILPYSDIGIKEKAFKSIQRIGATGILKGEGKNIGWKNHTHIYPDSLLTIKALQDGLKGWIPLEKLQLKDTYANRDAITDVISELMKMYDETFEGQKSMEELINEHNIKFSGDTGYITRKDFALLLDKTVNPFEKKGVNHKGTFVD